MRKEDELFVDCFAGGGGVSKGMEMALGRNVDIAINHDPEAVAMHKVNHPGTMHYVENIWKVDPIAACAGKPVALAWFSPDCRHFSRAKGGVPVDRKVRGLPWVVLKWAGTVRPRMIIVENVEEFKSWGRIKKGRPIKSQVGRTFRRWIKQLVALGYEVRFQLIAACDIGAPTTRERLCVCARRDGERIVFPSQTHADKDTLMVRGGIMQPYKTAGEIIDFFVPSKSIFERKRSLVENTMRRIARGINKFVLDNAEPFILKFQQNSIGQQLDEPLHTVMAGATRFGIITPSLIQYHGDTDSGSVRGQDLSSPIMTIDTSSRYGLSTAVLTKYPSRCKDEYHMDTFFISKYYGGFYTGAGSSMNAPLDTITTVDHNALVGCRLRNTAGEYMDSPGMFKKVKHKGKIKTIIVKVSLEQQLYYWPKVRDMLNRYCGYNLQDDEILHLEIGGHHWYIADILMRMLTPRELFNGQGFPRDYIIDHDEKGKAILLKKQISCAGNSVCPQLAEAFVRANFPEYCVEEQKAA